jgi:hypothetical protein
MRPGHHQTTPTVAQVVHRAVEACTTPAGADPALDDLRERFEDRDEPVTALLGGRERHFFEEAGSLEGQDEVPALTAAAAVATYLAFRRDQIDDDDEHLLRLAVRAEFDGAPPPGLRDWLTQQGVEI